MSSCTLLLNIRKQSYQTTEKRRKMPEKNKRDEKGRIIDGKAQGKQFSPDYQPANAGRKPDPFKAALEELAQSDGQFVVSQTELIGLFDIREGEDGQPLITIRGEWARDANGQPDKRLALITVQLPDATAIVAQWFRDAKSRKDNIRTRCLIGCWARQRNPLAATST